MPTKQYIKQAPLLAFKNREQISKSLTCGCYNCLKIFNTSEIDLWTDNGETALCPNCNYDSLIGDALGVPIRSDVLAEIHNYWFKTKN